VTSIPDITRMIARIETWQEGKALGRAEAARRLDEAHKLFDGIEHMLTDMRRELLGSGRQRWCRRPRCLNGLWELSLSRVYGRVAG
jgi:hypothetical protein